MLFVASVVSEPAGRSQIMSVRITESVLRALGNLGSSFLCQQWDYTLLMKDSSIFHEA